MLCLITVIYYQKAPLRHIRQGVEFRQKKKWPEAAESFQKALSFNKNLALPYVLLGEQYLSAHDFARSDFYFKKALVCADTEGKARYCLGITSACRGDFTAMSRIVMESAARDKDKAFPALLKHLAAVMFPLREEMKAGLESEDVLRALIAKSPDSLFLNVHLGLITVYQRRFDSAMVQFQRLAAAHPDTSFLQTCQGIALMGKGNDEEALSALIRAKQMDGGDALACEYLGRLYMDMNLDEKSLQELQKALEISPRSPGALYFMGLWNMKKGKMNEAAGFFEKSLGRQPNHGSAHQKLGEVCEKLGYKKRAAKESEERKIMDGPLYISAPPL